MGIGLLGGQVGLAALPGIKPRPSPHTGPNDGKPNASADDPGTDTHATVTASPDAAIVRKLLKLV